MRPVRGLKVWGDIEQYCMILDNILFLVLSWSSHRFWFLDVRSNTTKSWFCCGLCCSLYGAERLFFSNCSTDQRLRSEWLPGNL